MSFPAGCDVNLCIKCFFIYKERKEREKGGDREKERNTDLLFHFLMHLLIDSSVHPDWGSNPATLVYRDNTPTNLATRPRHPVYFVLTGRRCLPERGKTMNFE